MARKDDAASTAIDAALAAHRGGPAKPDLSADELAGQLGNALQRWPDAFDGRDADEVSHIIDILDRIAEGE